MFKDTSEIEALAGLGVRSRCRLITLVILVVCFCASTFTALAQEVTKSTGGITNPKTNPSSSRLGTGSRRHIRRGPRAVTPGVSRGNVSEQSDNFVELGDTFAEKSKWRAAEAAYKEAIALSPGNADAYAGLGTLYNDQGRHGEAYSPFNKARQYDPSNALASYGLGYASMRLGKYNEAVSFFRQALNLQPDFAQAYFDLGLTYLEQNNKQAALSQHDKLKALDTELAQELLTEINKK